MLDKLNYAHLFSRDQDYLLSADLEECWEESIHLGRMLRQTPRMIVIRKDMAIREYIFTAIGWKPIIITPYKLRQYMDHNNYVYFRPLHLYLTTPGQF